MAINVTGHNGSINSDIITIGPVIHCENVDNISTKNKYICIRCDKRNPVILTLSITFSFIFGAFLDNICCCIKSTSQRALLTAFLTVVVAGVLTGGIVGKNRLISYLWA